jgi:membrane-bound acyltransferase YfiQ involved in biofilm formation
VYYAAGIVVECNLPHFQMVQNVSRYSYAIYLFHMVFIPPLYVVTHFDGGKAALWQCCLWPVLTSVVVLLMGYFVCWLLCKCFSKHQWLGIN